MKHIMHLVAAALILSFATACTKTQPPVQTSTGKTVAPLRDK